MKYLLTIVALLISPFTLFSQATPVTDPAIQLNPAQTAALDEAKALNVKVVAFYNQQKFGDALKLAKQVQTLIESNDLLDDQSALAILSNVGDVMLTKGKESEAIALFDVVLAAYRRRLGANSVAETAATERIARAFYRKPDYGKAAQWELKFVALAEKVYGPESKKLANAYSFLGDIYQLGDKPERAEDAYLKTIAINDQALTFEENSTRTDVDHYVCFLYHAGFAKGQMDAARAKVFQFEFDRAPKIVKARSADVRSSEVVSGGVLEGKALSLPKPDYPSGIQGTGFAIVQIKIDESGNVIEAKGICGMSAFYQVAEAAALKSKFAPTKLTGLPVKVTGTINYNFGGR